MVVLHMKINQMKLKYILLFKILLLDLMLILIEQYLYLIMILEILKLKLLHNIFQLIFKIYKYHLQLMMLMVNIIILYQ